MRYACHNVLQHQIHIEAAIPGEYVSNTTAVRQTLPNHGITPENMLPAEDIKKAKYCLSAVGKNSLKQADMPDYRVAYT